MIARKLSNRDERLDLIFLLVKNKREEVTILPDDNYQVQVSDTFLIASTKEAKEDFELIINNINELDYVLYGKENKFGLMKKLDKILNKKDDDE